MALIGALAVPLAFTGEAVFLEAAVGCVAAGVVLAWALPAVGRLFEGAGLSLPGTLGLANRLTLARCVLIAPTVVFLIREHWVLFLAAYGLLVATDVADGAVARRRGERTDFGTIMDPAADVASTGAVYTVFFAKSLLPGWVFAILLVRYGTLALGSLWLSRAARPFRFRATPAGKAAAVLQAAGAAAVALLERAGPGWETGAGRVLFPLLGTVFGSVIVSQLVIGIRHYVGTRRS